MDFAPGKGSSPKIHEQKLEILERSVGTQTVKSLIFPLSQMTAGPMSSLPTTIFPGAQYNARHIISTHSFNELGYYI